MARTVRAALIQAHANLPKEDALAKHVELIDEAAR
jgi:predicted amidohydrolase